MIAHATECQISLSLRMVSYGELTWRNNKLSFKRSELILMAK